MAIKNHNKDKIVYLTLTCSDSIFKYNKMNI